MPKAGTLVLIALAAMALSIAQSDLLHSGLRERLEPVYHRVAGAATGICFAATAGLAGGEDAHVAGAVLAAVPFGHLAAGLDAEGYIAAVDSAAALGDVPLLTGFTVASTRAGASASSPQAFLGITVVKAFAGTPGLADKLKSVDLSDLEDPEVTLECGTVVKLGTGGYALKLLRLREVLAQAAFLGMKPTLIDLRFRDQVIVRPGTIKSGKDREV